MPKQVYDTARICALWLPAYDPEDAAPVVPTASAEPGAMPYRACAVLPYRFFDRLHRNNAGILAQLRRFCVT